MNKSIVAQMMQNYENYTKSEKKIVDYVLSHKLECQHISITTLSAECNVALATISSFCKKLELTGYNEFKLELAKADMMAGTVSTGEPAEIQQEDTAAVVMQKILTTEQENLAGAYQLLKDVDVRKASALIGNAGQVLVLGQGNSFNVASVAWIQFSMVSPKFKTAQGAHLQLISMSTLTERDVVLYFSYSGATIELMEACEFIKKVGARLILVTRFANAPAAKYADVVLLCGAREENQEAYSMESVFCQLYVVDVLLGQYYKQHQADVLRYRKMLGVAFNERRVLIHEK